MITPHGRIAAAPLACAGATDGGKTRRQSGGGRLPAVGGSLSGSAPQAVLVDELYRQQLFKPDLINQTARCAVEGARDWRRPERINQRRF